MIIEALPILMFVALAALVFSGYPVAFVLGGIGLAFGLIGVIADVFNFNEFYLIVLRIYGGVIDNPVLVAVPMFIFMGTMLEKSGIAEDLLNSLQVLSRRIPGGLALSVTLLGTILAATTGIIGASVVMITLLALPIMMRQQYHIPFATGTIAASGTLGILIPPSIMLVIMGSLLSISVGKLFLAAVLPGLLLAGLYLGYILIRAWLRPDQAPPLPKGEAGSQALSYLTLIASFLPPVILIILVLGSIFAGVATPTEAAGVGAFGATLLALVNRRLNFSVMRNVCERSALTGAMIFGIFIGATAFSYVFRSLGGDELVLGLTEIHWLGSWGLLIAVMILIFLLGFFFDWIEITLIILPVFAPIIGALDFSPHLPDQAPIMLWFAVLVAVNLQTSFLTPPFGLALFYLKGAAPAGVPMLQIYRGIIPFVCLQLAGLAAVVAFPALTLWLPAYVLG